VRAGALELGDPSDRSAVIIRARLPARLERLRRAGVPEAARGLPAHLTMLYPFVDPTRLGPEVRGVLAGVAGRTAPLGYHLVGAGQWPGVVHLTVDPTGPFVRLQADLQTAFPAFRIYAEPVGFDFIPHVTVAEGGDVDAAAVLADPAWSTLPLAGEATAIEVIVRSPEDRWRTVWRIALGGSSRGPSGDRRAGKIRP